MTKIAIEPNASGSGTFTITSPNSNDDRTLTLPDEAGELLTDQRLASEAEAEAGTDNSKLMTPLRTAQAIAELAGGGVGIGQPFPVWDHIPGAEVPDNSGTSKFIRLTAGQSGSGGYNQGLLGSESVSGSAPLVTATATILVGPMSGQTVPLINTEMSFIRPGTSSGTLQFDQMQRITGFLNSRMFTVNIGAAAAATGAFSTGASQADSASRVGVANRGYNTLTFNSANSPDARTSSTTDGETRSKNRQATFYMRIV